MASDDLFSTECARHVGKFVYVEIFFLSPHRVPPKDNVILIKERGSVSDLIN